MKKETEKERTRREEDPIGSVELPKDCLYGIETKRALENFPVSGRKTAKELIDAIVLIKKAAALANRDAGLLSSEKAEAIGAACDEVLSGDYADAFPTDALQGGAGTSTNMNVNEVLANIGLRHMGHACGDYRWLHPLDDVNMQFAPGEFVSIVGPSGCGKSTIIRMVDDIIKPTSGKITVDNVIYDNQVPITKEQIKRLGFIFQLPNLYPWLTIRENLQLPLKVYGMMDQEHLDYVEELLDMIGLSDCGDVYPSEISGGMAQRIGVIRGMVHKPEMLMMDEPFGALDDETREHLNIEMLNIWEKTKMTIIFITHNVSEAVLLSQRIYVMQSHPGKVKAEVAIPFEGERTLELLGKPEFGHYCRKIEDLIGKIDLNDVV